MNETTSTRAWLADKWERLIAVDVPDEEEARRGRLFNTLMVISTGIVTTLALTFVLIWALGLTPAFAAWLGAAFPLAFIPISLFCLAQARRGRVRPMIALYVWVNFFGIALAALVFDGIRSNAWVLYIWTITIAGTLLAPGYALRMTGLVVGYSLLLLLLTWLGLYAPPLTLGPEGREFASVSFTMIMLVSTVGLLTYLNMRSLRETLGRLRTATRELEEHRRTLEQRVAERTADLTRRSAQLEAAAQVARGAAAIRDVNQLLDATVRLISDRFGFYHAGIFLVDDAGEYAVLRAASSEGGRRMLERGHRLKVGEVGIVGWVAGTGEPRVALDVGEDAVFFDNPDLPHTRSEMALPLKVRGQTIGVLDVQSTEEAAFTKEDVAVLQTMADQLAVAIENARLFRETQERLRELSALYRDYTRQAWGVLARAGRVHGYSYDRVDVSPVTADRPPEVQQALREGRIVAVGGENGGEAALAIPISVRGEVIGVLDLRKSEGTEGWTPEEMRWVERVSDQLGLALESARLFEETRRMAEREYLVREITARVRASMDMDTILQAAVRELGRALGTDRAFVQLSTGTKKDK